jgi:uncharacterized protein YqgV (UPF0045/DUF77 family)
MIVALSISPSGPPLDPSGPGGAQGGVKGRVQSPPDAGVSEVVAEAVREIRASGLPCETNAMFTNIEGEWDEVMAAVKRAVDVVTARYPRVGLVLKADIRPGYVGQLSAKVERVEQHLSGGAR